MPLYHAVVWTDHHTAQVLQFDAEHVVGRTLHDHPYSTQQHHSGVRTQHEFDAALCDALDGVVQVLITGSHTATSDLKHYVDKHRPALAARVVAYEIVDHPTEPQLVALARRYFVREEPILGVPTK